MSAGPVPVVYFVQAGSDGPIKIGVAVDMARRLSTLQTGSPLPLRVLGTIPVREAREFEQGVHRRLREHRLHGEWFRPAPSVLHWATVASVIDGRRRSEVDERVLWEEIEEALQGVPR